MIVRPELAALRRGDAAQQAGRQAVGAALEQWRAAPPVAAALAQFGAFAAGAPLHRLPALAALVTPGGCGAALASALVEGLAAQLARHPLAPVPLQHAADGMLATLVLARCNGAAMVLQAVDGTVLATRPAPSVVSFAPTELWEHVLAGQARVDRVRIVAERPGGADLAITGADLAAGHAGWRLAAQEAQVLRRAGPTLVTLRLQRPLGGSATAREYRLADGALVRQAAGRARDSRLELAAAVLGRMGRTDAAPLLAALAREAGGDSLRWQALRECLALDAGHGFAALSAIAAGADDPLAAPAAALRGQLLARHPALAEAAPCPA